MDRRYVRLDPGKLDFLRIKKGWNLDALVGVAAADPHCMDKRTVKAIIKGEQAFLNSAKIVAEILGAEDLVSVLHPELLAEIGPPSGWGMPLEFFSTVGEWEAVQSLGPAQRTANGLAYDIWKMRHRHLDQRLGRGKCYDLNKLSSRERTRLKGYLTRHVEVCDRIGRHPQIAQNRSVTPWEHGAYWWVVDEWIEGSTLATLLDEDRITADQAPLVLRQIAAGLAALHAAGVVRRELSPRYVIVRDADGGAVLTDFELAKLLDGGPTVAPADGWPDDDYRAVEVDSTSAVDARADIYSWGRIAIHAVCGALPAKGAEAGALDGVTLPTAVKKTLLACVAAPRSDRPATIEEVLAGIKKW
jgi:serine/threonine protein kinase